MINFLSAYDVGVDYHAIGANFTDTVFITQYHIPSIRSTVLDQLQGIVNKGATFVSLAIWFVNERGMTTDQHWRATFPMTGQEMANLHQYALDVAQIQSTLDGHRLHLDIAFGWLGAADYQIGNPTTGLGYYNLSASEFTSRVESTTDSVIQALSNIKRPDGALLVQTVYLEGEVMIGAKKNQEWFISTHYPRFLRIGAAAGFNPAIYFIAEANENHVLEPGYIDPQFPALNGHRSMFWIYRTLNFLKTQQLPFPERIDFSCYINRNSSTYSILTTRILDDADAALSVLGANKSYGIAETYYFVNETQRRQLGQGFALEAVSNSRLKRLSFWTTPDAGGPGIDIAYPFAVDDYLPIIF
jgi:hypothetical protein